MVGGWHLAQLNVARALAPLEDPLLVDFVAALDGVNALAEGSPGFVWRLKGEDGNATSIRINDDPRMIVNMSVWESVEALFDFAYRSDHTRIMARRREWFEKPSGAYMVLWWVSSGHRPSVEEATLRLECLDREGPTARAFTFKTRFPAPAMPGVAVG